MLQEKKRQLMHLRLSKAVERRVGVDEGGEELPRKVQRVVRSRVWSLSPVKFKMKAHHLRL